VDVDPGWQKRGIEGMQIRAFDTSDLFGTWRVTGVEEAHQAIYNDAERRFLARQPL
jgi:hypothetical protein